MRKLLSIVFLLVLAFVFRQSHAQSSLGFTNSNGFPTLVSQGSQYTLWGWIVNNGSAAYTGNVKVELEANGTNTLHLDNNFAISGLQPGDSVYWSKNNYNFPPGQMRLGHNDVLIWSTAVAGSSGFASDTLSTQLYYTEGAAFRLNSAGFERFGGQLDVNQGYSLSCNAVNLGDGVNAHDVSLYLRQGNGKPYLLTSSGGTFSSGQTVEFFVEHLRLGDVLGGDITQMTESLSEGVSFFALENECGDDPLNEVRLDLTFTVGAVGPFAATEVKLFPNPTNGNVSIELPKSWGNAAEVRILDLAGREVIAKTMVSGVMDVSVLPSGTYVVEVVRQGAAFHTKFIKN